MQFIKINILFLLLLRDAFAEDAAGVANVSEVNFQQALAASLAAEEEEDGCSSAKKLLSRKRRYLLFPEGSSFQLVYDEIIGIVDYTNYLILGITVALAWELPSKPPSEQLEHLRTRLQDGTLGLTRRNDTIASSSYSDSFTQSQTAKQGVANADRNLVPTFHAPMHPQYYYRYTPNTNHWQQGEGRRRFPEQPLYRKSDFGSRNRDFNGAFSGQHGNPWHSRSFYYTNNSHPFAKWSNAEEKGLYTTARTKYPWWKLATRISNSLGGKATPAAVATARSSSKSTASAARGRGARKHQQQQQQQRRRQQGTGSTRTRKHRIFPVFGKRSVAMEKKSASSTPTTKSAPQAHHRQRRSGVAGQQLSQLDRIHIRHHRSTRQELYEKIAQYLDKRGSHGSHCVLRALCETGQKSHERVPGSFVGELMRTIFTLPEPVEEHEMSDEARQSPPLVDSIHQRKNHYDEASAYVGDCAKRYEKCQHSLWKSAFVA